MSNDLISRKAFREKLNRAYEYTELGEIIEMLDNFPTVERPKGEFTIDELEKWLYEIAYNNNNEFGQNCLEIIGRLDGFERFVADMRKETENEND